MRRFNIIFAALNLGGGVYGLHIGVLPLINSLNFAVALACSLLVISDIDMFEKT